MAGPDAADRVELSTREVARLLASGMRDELLIIMREMFERNAFADRLAYSPDEAAELLGISTELVHDLLRTGQLGSVKAGRRRLIGKHYLEEFLAREQRQPDSPGSSAPSATDGDGHVSQRYLGPEGEPTRFYHGM